MITLQEMAEKFTSTTEAFNYFLQEIYPNLKTEDKNKIKKTKYDFLSERVNVSEKKLEEVLEMFGNVEIKKTIEIIFK